MPGAQGQSLLRYLLSQATLLRSGYPPDSLARGDAVRLQALRGLLWRLVVLCRARGCLLQRLVRALGVRTSTPLSLGRGMQRVHHAAHRACRRQALALHLTIDPCDAVAVHCALSEANSKPPVGRVHSARQPHISKTLAGARLVIGEPAGGNDNALERRIVFVYTRGVHLGQNLFTPMHTPHHLRPASATSALAVSSAGVVVLHQASNSAACLG